jgi:hypothetical protein
MTAVTPLEELEACGDWTPGYGVAPYVCGIAVGGKKLCGEE